MVQLNAESDQSSAHVANALWVSAVVACVGVLSALLVRHVCVAPGPPVTRPEPGTPRAGYCATMHGASLWLLLVVVPALLTLVGVAVAGRERPIGWVVAGAAAVAVAANVVVVHSLSFSYTI